MTITQDQTAHPHNCAICGNLFYCTLDECDEQAVLCENCTNEPDYDDNSIDDFEEEEQD